MIFPWAFDVCCVAAAAPAEPRATRVQFCENGDLYNAIANAVNQQYGWYRRRALPPCVPRRLPQPRQGSCTTRLPPVQCRQHLGGACLQRGCQCEPCMRLSCSVWRLSCCVCSRRASPEGKPTPGHGLAKRVALVRHPSDRFQGSGLRRVQALLGSVIMHCRLQICSTCSLAWSCLRPVATWAGDRCARACLQDVARGLTFLHDRKVRLRPWLCCRALPGMPPGAVRWSAAPRPGLQPLACAGPPGCVERCRLQVVHRDLKSANVLIARDLTGAVAFALSWCWPLRACGSGAGCLVCTWSVWVAC